MPSFLHWKAKEYRSWWKNRQVQEEIQNGLVFINKELGNQLFFYLITELICSNRLQIYDN